MVKDGLILMYCKDGIIYPVAMTEEQINLLQLTGKVFEPIKVMIDAPLGPAVNLMDKEEANAIRGN